MVTLNIWQLFINGIGLSSFYALFAVGLSLVFGVMKIINFAHGELYMLGAYCVWFVISTGSGHLSLIPLFFLGLVLAILVVGGVGLAIERGIFRPLRLSPFSGFMASVGLLYVLQVSVGEAIGFKGKIVPEVFPGVFEVAGAILSMRGIVTILAAVILLGLLWFFLERTRLGRAVRASSQDSEAAAMQGIKPDRMSALVMAMGGALAGAAGAFVGTSLLVTPFMGWVVLWKAFIVTIVGGMGSIGGAIVAALLFGFLDSLVITMSDPRFVVMIDVLIMLLILAFRPQGLLGHEK